MGTVDLDNGLDDPLLNPLHAIKFFVQDPPCFYRIYRFKILALPLYIHHKRQRSLCMTALLRGNFMRTGNRQVSSGPQTDIFRHGIASTSHEIRNALNTGQTHIVTGLFSVLILVNLHWRITCQQSLDHKL